MAKDIGLDIIVSETLKKSFAFQGVTTEGKEQLG